MWSGHSTHQMTKKSNCFYRNEKPFLQKLLKGTVRFLKTGFFVAERRTTVENDNFRPLPISTTFSFKNVKHGHVSGNIDFRWYFGLWYIFLLNGFGRLCPRSHFLQSRSNFEVLICIIILRSITHSKKFHFWRIVNTPLCEFDFI